jgi:FAD/FMN-containing dehydrogenase
VADGALVVDLGPSKGISVDPRRRTARVGAGVLLGELDRATQTFGLAAPMGAVTQTGVSGLTLGGGIGWLMRKLGLSVDRLRSVDLVTADGGLVRASAVENPDLFWGVRGGGGNFGVVTELEFDLRPVGPTVYAGPLLWPLDLGHRVAEVYRDWIAAVPDELTTAIVARRAPALPFVPDHLRGRHVFGVVCCYAGPLAQGERVLRPLRQLCPPAVDLCEPKHYVEHQAMFDSSFPHGLWVYMRAHDVQSLGDDVLDIVLDHAERLVSDSSTVTVWQLGGAVARVGVDDTAFSGRRSAHIFNITGATHSADGFETEHDWVHAFSEALAPHQSGVYVNFLMDEGSDRVRQSYGPAKFERLRALKRRYDPHNVFRLNQNIPPN